MFPQETHEKIVKRIDVIEARLFDLYRNLAGLRNELQRTWKVLPNGGRWTPEAHDATLHE